MKRSAHSVYYDTSTEQYLEYENLKQYARECHAVDQLPLDDLVLLKHMRALARFVEALVVHVYDALDEQAEQHTALTRAIMEVEKGDDDAAVDDVQAVMGVAWYWHKQMRQRGKEVTGLYANALLLSWSAYCKLFHLYVVQDQARYEALQKMTSDHFPYARLATEDCNAVASNDLLLHYTLQDLWAATRRIAPTLYKYVYHAEMKHYFHALFFRYCDFFCSVQDSRLLAKMMDHPLFCAVAPVALELVQQQQQPSLATVDEREHYDTYRQTQVRLSERYVLKSEYFYEGELLFFYQLSRLRLAEELHEQQEKNPLILAQQPTEEELNDCDSALVKMLHQLVVHPSLKKPIVEDFRTTILTLYLYHGEKERFARRNPTAPCEPNDVLTASRPRDHEMAVAMRQATLGELLTNKCVKEIVLIAKCATHRWLAYEEVRQHAAVRDAFLIDEQLAIEALEELVERNELGKTEVPTLLKLVQVHYVLYKGAVYKSARFIDAYMLWLALLTGASGLVQLCQIHPLVRELVPHFSPCC